MRAHFYIKSILLFLTLLAGFISRTEATHIRAGEITAQRINNTTYIFTLTIYGNRQSGQLDEKAIFKFSDGTEMEDKVDSHVNLNADTYRRIYTCTKAFSGSGTFRVSYNETYRVEGIENLENGHDFYVETYISITSFSAFNNPVQLTNPPIDKAAIGKLFVHNAGAYDIDGDSISYKLIIPKSAPGTNVPKYKDPPNQFYLDAVTGDLIWNAPDKVGLYNVAFIIEEWKKGLDGTYARVGFVTRDMQIEVVNTSNRPPVLIVPDDTCIVAGNPLIKTIRASDPDAGDRINIYSSPTSHFSFSGPQFSVASGSFDWTPQCTDIREQPYTYVFKAEDVGNVDTLTDYETWMIYVKGPAPTGLIATATATGNSIGLNWNPYPCPNASKIEIYRKACDSSGYKQTVCETGADGFPGYVKIGEVPATQTSFPDNSVLRRGIEYCYFIVAKFPLPKGGESRASLESCSGLQLNVPVLSNATVTVTSSSAGEVQLNWLDPLELTGPFTYHIQRARGINGSAFTTIVSNFSGNTYTDTGLNTLDSGYTYRIELVGGGTSDPASTTYLRNTPGNRQLNLTWSSTVPWKEDSVWLYRSVNGSPFVLHATFKDNPKQFTDNQGLSNCDTACYYLRIFSSFCDPRFPSMVYENFSETNCGVPVDITPPRAPALTVRGCEGDLTVFTDYLDWEDVADPLCPNIKKYNVYFSEYSDAEPGIIAATDFSVTDYSYTNYQSTAGCFYVTAVNRQDVEGYPSNKICLDDCVYYELPNLITPNGDSLNDRFRPFPIPRGVEVVKFNVYNRWGGLVFSMDNNIELNWTGRSGDGEKLTDGIYYFSAEVKYFRRMNRSDEKVTLKGWVHVLDNTAPAVTE